MLRANSVLACSCRSFAFLLAMEAAALAATDVWSPHVTSGNWRTTISVYNSTNQPVLFQIAKYGPDGNRLDTTKEFAVSARDWFILPAEELSYDGTAHLTSSGSLLVKKSYRYQNSQSVCEFYLSNSTGNAWIIPNTVRDWFSWTGMALVNPTDSPIQVTLKALQNGTELGTQSVSLMPRQKFVRLSNETWPGLGYGNFDTILITSSQPIPPPISITGNDAQDRHLFFTAQMEPPAGSTLHAWAAHIATGAWKTSMSLFNSGTDAVDFRLQKYAGDGASLGNPLEFAAPPNSWFDLPGSVLEFDGAAQLTSARRLLVKVMYRYADSRSVCEFYLPSRMSMSWIIPNSGREWSSWTGLALVNPIGSSVAVTIKALQAGVERGASTIELPPRSKFSKLADEVWKGLSYSDFDTILVQSSVAIPAPISITGDTAQGRHIFLTAEERVPRLPEPVNLVKNGGFEAGLDNWQPIVSGSATFTRVAGNSPEGLAHIEITANSDTSSYAYAYQPVSANAGWPSLLSAQASFTGVGAGYILFSTINGFARTSDFSRWAGSAPWGFRPGNLFIPSSPSGSLYLEGGWGSRVSVDDVRLLQWDPSQIDGFEHVRHLAGSTIYGLEGAARVQGSGDLSFPLPIMHQGQVPLALRIYTLPVGRMTALSIGERWDRDWIVTVHVNAPDSTTVCFEALVLECELKDGDRLADMAGEQLDPSVWLTPTTIVQSGDVQIRAAAAEAVGNATTDRDKLLGILQWLKNYMTGSTFPSSLDAKSAYNAKYSSCTGWANLAGAIGRAAGIPTRIVVGYPAWGSPLQTHYINEFYLKDLGWCRVEPQPVKTLSWPFVSQSYMNIVGIMHPEQEGPEAMDPLWRTQHSIMLGVPLLSLFEVSGNLNVLWPPNYYSYAPYCDHSSFGKFNVNLDELGRLPYLAEVARARWKRFLDDAVAGRAQGWLEGKFNGMFAAQSLDEIEDALFVP